MTDRAARIVVTGLAATYPFGGVFWDYVQYVLGLSRLGHDVLYLEDTGRWSYDPAERTFVEAGDRNAAYLAKSMNELDPSLADRWFFRDARGVEFGMPWRAVVDFCATADLFLHISASCWMRDEYYAAHRLAFIDSDPMYTQASVPAYLAGDADDGARASVEMLLRHDVFFTFGENIGADDCLIPTDLFDWRPTRQPIVLEAFEGSRVPVASRRRMLTTVGSWRSSEGGTIVDGRAYGGKDAEMRTFEHLPRSSAIPMELALSGLAPHARLRELGWATLDAYDVSATPWAYRDYLATSSGEWSIAKEAYVASRSGWFSGRSACYLALGVPVVVQDTGFVVPMGDGVMGFSTPDEALHAIADLGADPERHAASALDIAHAYFDSRAVLSSLLDLALSGRPGGSSARVSDIAGPLSGASELVVGGGRSIA